MQIAYRIDIIKATIGDAVNSMYPGTSNKIDYHFDRNIVHIKLSLYDFGFEEIAYVKINFDTTPIKYCNPASLYQYGRVKADRLITQLEALQDEDIIYYRKNQQSIF